METILLYRHPYCPRCAEYARMHHRFDWLGCFKDSAEIPPTGQLRIGEIAVQNLRTRETFKGITCFRLLCKHSGVSAFQDKLTEYKTSKGAIQFPLDKPLPLALAKK